jgi:hypothetical protein
MELENFMTSELKLGSKKSKVAFLLSYVEIRTIS